MENQPQTENPIAPELLPLRVVVHDIHSGQIVNYPVETMTGAIQQYRAIQSKMFEVGAYAELDDYNWTAIYKLKGGLIRFVAITNGQKVLGRAQGAARRAQNTQQRRPVQPALVGLPELAGA